MLLHDRATVVLESSDNLGVGCGCHLKLVVLEFIKPVQDLINLIEVCFPEHFQVLPCLFKFETALFLQELQQLI
jgi:hypothetical protein